MESGPSVRTGKRLADFTLKEALFSASLLATAVLLLWLVWNVIAPLMRPIFWSAILAVTSYPLYRWVRKRFRERETLAALVSTLIVVLLIAGPITLFIIFAFTEFSQAYAHFKPLATPEGLAALQARLETPLVRDIIDRANDLFHVDLRALLGNAFTTTMETLSHRTGGLLVNLVSLTANFILTTIFLFFALRDGAKFMETARVSLPLHEENKQKVFRQFANTVHAVMIGIVATSAVQAAVALLGYFVVGLPYALLLGLVTFILSLFGIGPLVAILSIVYLLSTGKILLAVILAVFTVLMSTVDNLIRPYVISSRTHLHPVILFIFLIGGLLKYGFLGIFLGPIILATFDTVLVFVRETYFPPARVEGQGISDKG